MPSSNPPLASILRIKKSDRVLQGLRELNAEQEPGQCFTALEIAQRCGCSEPNIQQIEWGALKKLRVKLEKVLKEFDLHPAQRPDRLAA